MTIKEMLKSGKTPDDLIKEINEAQRELDNEQKYAKEIDASRGSAIDAIVDYLDLITGSTLSDEDIESLYEELKNAFKDIEKAVKVFEEVVPNKPKTKKYEFSFDELDEKDWQKLLKLFV